MRRTGHVRQRTPGSWEIRYPLGVEPATGKRKVVTTTIKGDRKQAERELRKRLSAADRGVHIDPSRVTMRDYLAGWLAEMRDEVAPLSYRRYSSVVTQHLLPGLGNHLLTRLAPVDLKAFYAGLTRQDGQDGSLGPRSRRQIHRVLAQSLERAVEQNMIARNPTDPFRRRQPRVEPKEMAVLDTAQQAELIEAVRGGQLYIPTLIALAIGARRSEVLGLRWRHADLDAGTVRIVETLEQTKDGIRIKPPKSGKPRTVTLPGFAVEALRHHRVAQAEYLLMLGVRLGPDHHICGTLDGGMPNPQAIGNQFHRFIVTMRSEFPRVRFHDLRHSHATSLLLAGVHAKVVQERLGHATIAITLGVYGHVMPGMQEEAAAKIDAAFKALR